MDIANKGKAAQAAQRQLQVNSLGISKMIKEVMRKMMEMDEKKEKRVGVWWI